MTWCFQKQEKLYLTRGTEERDPTEWSGTASKGVVLCSLSVVPGLILQVLALRTVSHYCFLVKFHLNSAVVNTELVFQLLVCYVKNFLWVVALFCKKKKITTQSRFEFLRLTVQTDSPVFFFFFYLLKIEYFTIWIWGEGCGRCSYLNTVYTSIRH